MRYLTSQLRPFFGEGLLPKMKKPGMLNYFLHMEKHGATLISKKKQLKSWFTQAVLCFLVITTIVLGQQKSKCDNNWKRKFFGGLNKTVLF